MDIDIDVNNNKDLIAKLGGYVTKASMIEDDELKPHLVGVYFQKIPTDVLTGLSAIPYKSAESFGYTKVDILNLGLLSNFDSRQEMEEILNMPPDWDMLKKKSIVERLFHISKHYELVKSVAPKSIEELADILALIRPNKRSLQPLYLVDRAGTRLELYNKCESSDLRKSHAISYAMNIVLHMNLIKLNKCKE